MATKKYKIQQLQQDETLLTLHPETDASVVKVDSSKTGTTATNVESAIKELKDDIQETANEIKDGVVTGVKGSNETQYRKGQVEITKANIGLGNVNNVAITNDQVTQIGTNKTDIDDLKLKVGNLSGAFKFQGTLNSILDLPNATINNKGYVYIINKKEYVSDGTKWVELGDESSFVLKTTYESHLQTQSNKDNAQDVEIANIKNGSTVVGKAEKDSAGNVIHQTYVQPSQLKTINGESIVGTGDIKTKLEDSGVVAGTYSVVEVNSKGIVTNGANLIEVGVASQVTPSDNLAVGGIFFQEI